MVACMFILNHTWGLLMTLVGYLVSLVLIITKHKPNREHGCLIFEVGSSHWGGITLGTTILVCKYEDDIVNHEKGHVIQNALMGPLFLFVVGLPSLARATCRTINYNRGKPSKTDYDSIWFEGTATLLGNYIKDR